MGPWNEQDTVPNKDAMTEYGRRSQEMYKLGRLWFVHGTLWLERPIIKYFKSMVMKEQRICQRMYNVKGYDSMLLILMIWPQYKLTDQRINVKYMAKKDANNVCWQLTEWQKWLGS
jgi:hypothetical protein